MIEPRLSSVADPGAINGNANPAQLSAQLGNLFPAGVVAVELLSEAPRTVLTESELTSISHCAAKRISDFTRGRAYAKSGLAELGIQDFSLLAGEKREPLLTPDIVGGGARAAGGAAAGGARRG